MRPLVNELRVSAGEFKAVMRDTAERPEGVISGALKLVDAEEDVIYCQLSSLLYVGSDYEAISYAMSPYGDGHLDERIVDILGDYL